MCVVGPPCGVPRRVQINVWLCRGIRIRSGAGFRPGDVGSPMSSFPPRRGAYGFDAPYAPLLMAFGGACLLAVALSGVWRSGMNSTPRAISIVAPGVGALWLFLNAGVYVHTTRAGKFAVWADLLDRLELIRRRAPARHRLRPRRGAADGGP